MKHFLFTIVIILFAVSAQAADVGVSVSVGQPSFLAALTSETILNPNLFTHDPL